MKIPYGLIYLVFLIIGLVYESYINHFSAVAYVNYLLIGFLYASVAFIVFYIILRIVLFIVNRVRHREGTD